MDFLHSFNIIILNFPRANIVITWMDITRRKALKERKLQGYDGKASRERGRVNIDKLTEGLFYS